MKRLCPVFIILLSLVITSCKKYIQQKEQQAALAIITDGYWYVQQYQQNDSDITASFSGYLFKFDANGIVTGTKDSLSAKGLWVPDIANKAISADFPTAGAPLSYLNEIWTITDSYTNKVVAKSTDSVTHSSNSLILLKQ